MSNSMWHGRAAWRHLRLLLSKEAGGVETPRTSIHCRCDSSCARRLHHTHANTPGVCTKACAPRCIAAGLRFAQILSSTVGLISHRGAMHCHLSDDKTTETVSIPSHVKQRATWNCGRLCLSLYTSGGMDLKQRLCASAAHVVGYSP